MCQTDACKISVVAAAQNGDAKCFEELYIAYHKKVFAIIIATLKNSADAEDVLQQTFINAWQNLKNLSDPSAFNTWIQRIAVRQCYTLLRKKNPQTLPNMENVIENVNTEVSETLIPSVYAEREDLRLRMRIIIENLSEVKRQAVFLYYYDGLKIEEIAEVLECGTNTVKSRLLQARKTIRDEIIEQERKTGEKFYGVAGIPQLSLTEHITLQAEAASLSSEASNAILQNTLSIITGGASTASTAAGSIATTGTTATSVATTAGTGIITKVIIGIVTIALMATATVIIPERADNPLPVSINDILRVFSREQHDDSTVLLAKKLISLYQTDGHEAVLDEMRTEYFIEVVTREMSNTGDESVVISELGDIGCGFYSYDDAIFVYIGGYDRDIRNGTGVWLNVNTNDMGYYVFSGIWSQDKPNGYGEIIKVMDINSIVRKEGTIYGLRSMVKGSYENGLANGVINKMLVREDGHTCNWNLTATYGYYPVIDYNAEHHALVASCTESTDYPPPQSLVYPRSG